MLEVESFQASHCRAMGFFESWSYLTQWTPQFSASHLQPPLLIHLITPSANQFPWSVVESFGFPFGRVLQCVNSFIFVNSASLWLPQAIFHAKLLHCFWWWFGPYWPIFILYARENSKKIIHVTKNNENGFPSEIHAPNFLCFYITFNVMLELEV